MSTITDLAPVLQTVNPPRSPSAGDHHNRSGDAPADTQVRQTTGGAGTDTQTHHRKSSRSDQSQASANARATERSSQSAGLKPANADAESVVLSKADRTAGAEEEPGEVAARRMNEIIMDKLRVDQAISGVEDARKAFLDRLTKQAGADSADWDPLASLSPAGEGEEIRLTGSTY